MTHASCDVIMQVACLRQLLLLGSQQELGACLALPLSLLPPLPACLAPASLQAVVCLAPPSLPPQVSA